MFYRSGNAVVKHYDDFGDIRDEDFRVCLKVEKKTFLGLQVVSGSIANCVTDMVRVIVSQQRSSCWFACLNPHSFVVAQDDFQFLQALHDADWVLPDGVGVVLASRILNCSVTERITGSDIFSQLHVILNSLDGITVFFLGSTDKVLSEIREQMALDYPNIRIVGTYSPPFVEEFNQKELDEIITRVNSVEPDILWVGMTAPKQEKWIYQHRHLLKVKFAGPIGAVFDFYTGRIKRSHPIYHKIGLEWLPRLLQEPRRLWRRMLVSAPIFLWHIALHKIGIR